MTTKLTFEYLHRASQYLNELEKKLSPPAGHEPVFRGTDPDSMKKLNITYWYIDKLLESSTNANVEEENVEDDADKGGN